MTQPIPKNAVEKNNLTPKSKSKPEYEYLIYLFSRHFDQVFYHGIQ